MEPETVRPLSAPSPLETKLTDLTWLFAETPSAKIERLTDALESANSRIAEFERILDGLPQDAIDGGWTAKGISAYAKGLEDRIAQLEAARIAYASEFPLNADGEPDVGNVHANIRAMKKALTEIAEQEHIELMLDPTWAQRVAKAAIAAKENPDV
jgi:hypothetical protein